jgi:hypothetical protein
MQKNEKITENNMQTAKINIACAILIDFDICILGGPVHYLCFPAFLLFLDSRPSHRQTKLNCKHKNGSFCARKTTRMESFLLD